MISSNSKGDVALPEPLELGDIQAIALTSYGHLRHATYLFLRLPRVGDDASNPAATITADARALLQQTAGRVNEAKIAHDRQQRETSAINLAFTFAGLTALGLSDKTLQSFPPEFQGGMTQDYRARALGDTGTNSPEFWQWGGTKPGLAKDGDTTQAVDGEKQPDLVLMCYAESAHGLDGLVADLKAAWLAVGATVIADERAEADMHDSREHFGFRDNITSVHIAGGFGVPDKGQPIIPAGEFVLGYKNAYDQYTATPRLDGGEGSPGADIGKNGTYVVFRKLAQDVPAFWDFCRGQAANLPNPTPNAVPPEFVGAKMVGRWRSGAPLALCPWADDPQLAADEDRVNDFGYATEDPKGFGCPFGAHVRRSNPRDKFSTLDPEASRSVVDHHRLLRRARSFGRPYDDPTTATPDGVERGLLFFCVGANIARQFEFVQQTWIMDPKFANLWNEPDPVMGQECNVFGNPPGGVEFTIPQRTARIRLQKVPQFVTVKAGAYLFLPGIAALNAIVQDDPVRLVARGKTLLSPATPGATPALRLGEEYPPADESALIDTIVANVQATFAHAFPPGGTATARRDQHPKAHGCVQATFTVHDNLEPGLRQGLFRQPGTYDAWLRFSSSSPTMNPDTDRDAHGMAIKILGVPGEKILPGEADATTQDFIIANNPVFFVRSTSDYVRFVDAFNSGKILSFFFSGNPLRWKFHEFVCMIVATKKLVANPLEIRYWSQTPYRLGVGQEQAPAIKYSVRPIAPGKTPMPAAPTAGFLRAAMVETLNQGDVTFEFMVQRQADPVRMPVEDPTITWDEKVSPFVPVATIHIPSQPFDTPERDAFAENLSYTPWHALPEHQPLGGTNRVRRRVYEAISALRHARNGVARVEPSDD